MNDMGVKNADGSACYIIGIRKDIRSKIGKQPGDIVWVTVSEAEEKYTILDRGSYFCYNRIKR